MKTLPTLFSTLLVAGACHGQDFDPALAGPAKIYRDQIAKLEEVRVNSLVAAQDTYLEALKEADEKATKDGNVKELAIIAKERESVNNGVILPVAPDDFPRKVLPARKACVKAFENADDTLAKEAKKLNGNYLATLGKIQSSASGNATLSSQIDSEKKRLLSGIVGPVANLETDLEGTRWQHLENAGDIRSFGTDKRVNQTWKYTIPEPTKVVIHWNENSSVTMELGRNGRTLLNGGKPEFVLISGAKKN